MNSKTKALIEKGKRSLKAARDLFDRGNYDFAASRSYYAMFYLAEALLLSEGLAFSKHSAVISAFGQYFIKPGLLPSKLHEAIRDAFDQRNIGDYEFDIPYPAEKAEALIKKAEEFINLVEAYLKAKPEGA